MKKILGLTLVTILGCGDGKGGSGTDSGSSGGSTGASSGASASGSSTDALTSSATQDSGSGSAGETEGASTSGVASVTEGSGGGVTTGVTTDSTGGSVNLMPECKALCDLVADCMLDAGPGCVKDCVGEFMGGSAECQQATDAYLMCLANMSCTELGDLFNNDQLGPCTDAAGAADAVCDMGGDCTTGIGGNPQGTECSWTTDCPDQPALEMQCTADQCVCLVDGVEMGTCPSDMVCKSIEQIDAKVADCCGF